MNCPGQGPTRSVLLHADQPAELTWTGTTPSTVDPATTRSRTTPSYKCYDGMHNWNQFQPAPYDGMYSFPSIVGRNPQTGEPTGTGCHGTALRIGRTNARSACES